jgi:opine dehydrogenase
MGIKKDDIWTVVGGGFGGKGLVGHLGNEGIRVRVHDISEEMIAPMREIGGLRLSGRKVDFVPLDKATTDLGEAIRGARVILVCTYGTEHQTVARQMAPHLSAGQIIVLCQGNFAGAKVFRRALEVAGAVRDVEVAEMDSFPYGVKIDAPNAATLVGTKAKWHLVAAPASRTGYVLDQIGWAFPGLVPASNCLETGFAEIAGMFHSAAMVTNVGRVEDEHPYNFYAANMVPSVCRLLERMDAERLALGAAYGAEQVSIRLWLKEAYGVDKPTFYESMQVMAHGRYMIAPAPKSLGHRYLVQDVACILVPFLELAKVAGVDMPATRVVVELAGLLTNRDFCAEGRNLGVLGWQGLNVQQIREDAAR